GKFGGLASTFDETVNAIIDLIVFEVVFFNYCDTYLNNCVTQYINTYLKIHKYTGNRPPCSY
ncbi:hypothetical protein BTG63_15155, partial [Acinetobacter baumannii]